MINLLYLTTLRFSFDIIFSIFLFGVGKSILSINIITAKTKTTIEETYQNNKQTPDSSEIKTSVSETFLHIGLPFWNTIEFHLGYHLMSLSKLDLTSKKSNSLQGSYTIDKKNYTGGMTTVGIQVAF